MTDTQEAGGPPSGRIARLKSRPFLAALIESNVLYVVSALLVMSGCRMLMHSDSIVGSEFQKTLKALLILQGYEVLLLGTALLIVRRLRIVSDAGKLFTIGFILLLDPTFFSNSFHTLYLLDGGVVESLGVNLVCFALAPVKLLIAISILNIHLSPRMWFAFCVACAIVYLAEFPIAREAPGRFLEEAYYIFAWTPFVLACAMPGLHRAGRFTGPRGYATDLQRRRLPRILVLTPLAFAVLHYFETAIVHEVNFAAFNLAPIVLLIVPVVIANTFLEDIRSTRLRGIDVVVAGCLLLSSPWFVPDWGRDSMTFPGQIVPVTVVAAIAVLLYGVWWIKFGDHRVVWRISLIGAVGFGYFAIRSGAIAWILENILIVFEFGLHHLTFHSLYFIAILWLTAIGLAWWKKHPVTWIGAGVMTAVFVIDRLGQPLATLVPELAQASLLFTAILALRFGDHRRLALRVVTVACIVGLVRYGYTAEAIHFAVFAFEILFTTLLAVVLRDRRFAIVAVAGSLAFGVWIQRNNIGAISWQVTVLLAGLLAFAGAVWVTFAKDRLLLRVGYPDSAASSHIDVSGVSPPQDSIT